MADPPNAEGSSHSDYQYSKSRNSVNPNSVDNQTRPIIFNNARTAAWIKADYNSGNDTLLTYGGRRRAARCRAENQVKPPNPALIAKPR